MLDKFLKGIAIIQPYYDDPKGYHLGAEHDTIYIYATDRPMGNDDVADLMQLGFFQPDVRVDKDEHTVEDYDPEEGWAIYI